MIKTINDKTVTVKITRGELCRLMLLCTTASLVEGKQWKELHDKLQDQLIVNDRKIKEKDND